MEVADSESGVRPHHHCHLWVALHQFLHEDAVARLASAGTTVLSGKRDTEETQFRHLLPQIERYGVGLLYLSRSRRNLLLSELPHRVAKQVVLLLEREIHVIPPPPLVRTVTRAP